MPRPVHRSPAAIAVVASGGAFGALARYAVAYAWPTREGGWPMATLLVNLTGAFVLGVLLEGLTRRGPDVGARRTLRLLAGTGFCGAFTTYSTFVHDVQTLSHAGLSRATLWAIGHVLAGITAAALGVWAGTRLSPDDSSRSSGATQTPRDAGPHGMAAPGEGR